MLSCGTFNIIWQFCGFMIWWRLHFYIRDVQMSQDLRPKRFLLSEANTWNQSCYEGKKRAPPVWDTVALNCSHFYLSLLVRLMMSLLHPRSQSGSGSRQCGRADQTTNLGWETQKKESSESREARSDMGCLVMSCIQTSRVTAGVVTAWVRGWHQRNKLSDRLWMGLIPRSHCSLVNAVIQPATGLTIC